MNIKESDLRVLIKDLINEFSIRTNREIPDRRFAISTLPKEAISSEEVSQTDALKLMSASTGFFQTLVDAIKFGFLTREEVNKICDILEEGCENNFKTLTVIHPCLKWWKNDVSKVASRIGDDTDFKRNFCMSVKSNCEMIKKEFNRALSDKKLS